MSQLAMDQYTKFDIASNFRRGDEILRTGVIQNTRERNPLSQSALIELLIIVRDLMAKCRKYSEPVDFADDVNITDSVKNASDAIKFVRDAMCHIDSPNHVNEHANARFSRNTITGKGTLGIINGVVFESLYEDDICYFFGSQKLYLKRHLIRAYEEARLKLMPLIG